MASVMTTEKHLKALNDIDIVVRLNKNISEYYCIMETYTTSSAYMVILGDVSKVFCGSQKT